jgi:two-component system response regulator CpxR
MSILIIDDDVELCAMITEYLSARGYEVDRAHDGASGLARLYQHAYDIVILDVMLPRLDGFEVLGQLRRRSDVPVILLTARSGHDDRLRGFNVGADDYLVKPFVASELLARIRAVLRRTHGARLTPQSDLRVGPLAIDPTTRRAWNGPVEIELTSMEFDLLQLLMSAAGRIVSRDEIATVLHQREATPFERAVDVHVSHLRKKLAPIGDQLLRTVRGVGYLLVVQE